MPLAEWLQMAKVFAKLESVMPLRRHRLWPRAGNPHVRSETAGGRTSRRPTIASQKLDADCGGAGVGLAFVDDDLPSLDDHLWGKDGVNVPQRVAVEHDDVGELARLNGAGGVRR